MPKVSVIIPVYNAAQYMAQCIESVITQTLQDIEVIIINDGSTDNSLDIITKYQEKDARITVINQNNQGVSAARNKGLEIATGEYIGFVDADDYVKNDMFNKMYNAALLNNVEIVISNLIIEQDGIIRENKTNFPQNIILNEDYIQQNITPFFIREDGLNSSCNKIYKKDLIHKKGITFPVGVTNGEDAVFNINIFNNAKKVFFVDYTGYIYREVSGSASRNILSKDYFSIAIKVFNFQIEPKPLISEKEINRLKSIRFINTIVSLIHLYFKPNKELSFKKRYDYVKNMINNKQVQQAINKHWKVLIKDKNRYSKFVLTCIKIKSVLGLLIATTYSNFRNK